MSPRCWSVRGTGTTVARYYSRRTNAACAAVSRGTGSHLPEQLR